MKSLMKWIFKPEKIDHDRPYLKGLAKGIELGLELENCCSEEESIEQLMRIGFSSAQANIVHAMTKGHQPTLNWVAEAVRTGLYKYNYEKWSVERRAIGTLRFIAIARESLTGN